MTGHFHHSRLYTLFFGLAYGGLLWLLLGCNCTQNHEPRVLGVDDMHSQYHSHSHCERMLEVDVCVGYLRDCPPVVGPVFDPVSLIRCVNQLMRYDKKVVCSAMEAYLSCLANSRFVTNDDGGGTKIQLLAILLFSGDSGGNSYTYMELQSDGWGPHPFTTRNPVFPLFIVNDLPLLLIHSEPATQGLRALPYELLEVIEKPVYTLRTTPYAPYGSPVEWMRAVQMSEQYTDALGYCERYGMRPETYQRMLRVQCLRALRPALVISEHTLEDKIYINEQGTAETEWLSAIEMLQCANITWSPLAQEFVRN